MTFRYKLRATHSMIGHPRQGLERLRGRRDRRRDLRQLTRLTSTVSELYESVADWPPHLHEALGQPWPCQEADGFEQIWTSTTTELRTAGMRVGMLSYGGWNDGDRAFAEAIWCIVANYELDEGWGRGAPPVPRVEASSRGWSAKGREGWGGLISQRSTQLRHRK